MCFYQESVLRELAKSSAEKPRGQLPRVLHQYSQALLSALTDSSARVLLGNCQASRTDLIHVHPASLCFLVFKVWALRISWCRSFLHCPPASFSPPFLPWASPLSGLACTTARLPRQAGRTCFLPPSSAVLVLCQGCAWSSLPRVSLVSPVKTELRELGGLAGSAALLSAASVSDAW